jgi:hypothetical protein
MKDSKQLRKEAAIFMDGLIKFKSPIIEALDRTFWRGFFFGIFLILNRYITIGLRDEFNKIFAFIKNDDYDGLNDYAGGLLDAKIDIPFIEDEYEKQYFITAVSFLNSTIRTVKNKVIKVYNSAEADDLILD